MKIWKRTVAAALAALMVAGAMPALATDPAEETAEATVEVVETAETTETATLVDAENVETMETAELDQTPTTTPELEITGMGQGLNHHLMVAVNNVSAGTTEIDLTVSYDANAVTRIDVENRNLGTTTSDGGEIHIVINELDHMGAIAPIAIDFQLREEQTEDVTVLTEGYAIDESGATLTMAPTTFVLPVTTPVFEAVGKGGGLNADFTICVSDYRPSQVANITFWAEMPENVRVCNIEAHQNSTTEMDDTSFRVTVDVPETMGIVEPIRVLLYATLAGTYNITFHAVLNYRDGGHRELGTDVVMTATPFVEMWEFYGENAIAFVHGMTENELNDLTAFLATYSPEGQMLTMRTASVNYSEAITGPCGRVSFELTEPCEMQEGNSQRLFFLDSACRPILPAVQVPNGTMNGIHLGPSAYGPTT